MNRRMLSVCLGVCFALITAGAARGQDVGVSEHTILIGRLTPKGSANFAGIAKQRTGGADAYIASVNAAGGVPGSDPRRGCGGLGGVPRQAQTSAELLAHIDGAVGAVFAPGGQPRVAFEFVIEDGRIVEIALVADPERIRRIELAFLDE